MSASTAELLVAWRDGDAEVRTWLGGAGSGDDLAAGARAFLAGHGWDRRQLADILTGMGDAQGDRLASPTVAAVVAGQQPAVGGGPLYTLVKTATAIAVAQRLEAAGVPAQPVFWCASEDHDLGEAGHADLVLRDGGLRRFTAALGGGRASLRFRPAVAWWDALVAQCRLHLGAGLGSDWLLAQRPHGDEGMGAWLCRLLRTLFASHRLVAVEGHVLRPLWHAHLRQALDRWPADALAAQRARLLARGFPDALGALDQPPLFADRADGRVALDAAAARALLAAAPDDLSPGAALRPALQQVALPAAIAVLGPGELAYHAAIGPVYGALGAPRPRPWPRPSLTLLPAWWRRGAAAWGLDAATVAGGAAPSDRGTEAAMPRADLDAPLADLDAALAALAADADATADHDRSRRLRAGLVRLRRERDRLARSLERGAGRAAGRPALGALRAWLRPRGAGQDRTLSLFQALWEHGPGLADLLVAAAARTPPAGAATVDL